MELSEYLYSLTNEYHLRSTEGFSSNPFGNFVRNDLANAFREKVPPHFKVKASVGQGVWTAIPWVGIFHPLETDTAQKGFYVVYLVNPLDKSISLSLNQGVKAVEVDVGTGHAARAELKRRANILIGRTGKLAKPFTTAPIVLGSQTGPGLAYEAGHAFGCTYTQIELSNSFKVEHDLQLMLEHYNDLVRNNGYIILSDNDENRGNIIIERKKFSLHQRFDRVGGSSAKVKKLKGYVCEVCGFDFQNTYGDLGREYIEAHHLIPFADLDVDEVRDIDMINDFAVLCANCHRMAHRQEDPSDIKTLKKVTSEQRTKIIDKT